MPLVDVNDLLVDPDIAGQLFTVLRRQQQVNNFGEMTWLTQRIPAVGSIQPTGDNQLIRQEGADAQADTIQIVTSFRLRGVASGPNNTQFKPDMILWQGNFYEVFVINSWSDFGRGLIDATATSVKYIDGPEPELAPYIGQLDFSRNANSGYAHGAMGGI